MNFLLSEYQNGSETASLYILDNYNYFINQFMDLLYNDDYDKTNHNLLDFLELYDSDNIDKALEYVHEIALHLTPQEMYQEIVAVILTLAYQCDVDDDFDIYLKVCFKYRFFEKLNEYSNVNSSLWDVCMFMDNDDTFWVLDNKDRTIFSNITILQRLILKMHYIDELSFFHIAEVLHVDYTTVDEEYDKAIHALKERVDY